MGNQMQPHRLGIKEKEVIVYKKASSVTRANQEAEPKKTMLSSKKVYGWDDTSEDYHAHITRMERSLSIIPGAPPYPDVHKAFNNKPPFEEAQANPGKQRQPRKVSFQDQQGHSNNGSSQVVHEETDDGRVEAEGYIQQKHRGFELCKWKSFKPY